MSGEDWQARLDSIYETMHEMSLQTDPQAMVRAYARRVLKLLPSARRISLSRRGLAWPQYRVTRFSEWKEEINPWKEQDRLPLLSGGLFAEFLYSNRPHIVDVLQVDPDDPAAPYLNGQQSLIAIPMLDGGEAVNMVISTRTETHGFVKEQFPEWVWLANLFGRATHNLVLKQQVEEAYEAVDREMQIVADIQRSLLPAQIPDMEHLELAACYQTSQRAGGDYYDFFPLENRSWGILIADVSGHGTPAAVVMAITHTIAHLYPAGSTRPGCFLEFVNDHLTRRYTTDGAAFVTAFFGVFHPDTRELVYASAGHNPPQLWRCATQQGMKLDAVGNLPLGVVADTHYSEATIALSTGDRIVFYTDGITEAANPDGIPFGAAALDEILRQACRETPQHIIRLITEAVDAHTGGAPPTDDRTLVVARVL